MNDYEVVSARARQHAKFGRDLMRQCWDGVRFDGEDFCIDEAKKRSQELVAIADKYRLNDYILRLTDLMGAMEANAQQESQQVHVVIGYLYEEFEQIAIGIACEVDSLKFKSVVGNKNVDIDIRSISALAIRALNIQADGKLIQIVTTDGSTSKIYAVGGGVVAELISASLRLLGAGKTVTIEDWKTKAFGIEGSARNPLEHFSDAGQLSLFRLIYIETQKRPKTYALQGYVNKVASL